MTVFGLRTALTVAAATAPARHHAAQLGPDALGPPKDVVGQPGLLVLARDLEPQDEPRDRVDRRAEVPEPERVLRLERPARQRQGVPVEDQVLDARDARALDGEGRRRG